MNVSILISGKTENQVTNSKSYRQRNILVIRAPKVNKAPCGKKNLFRSVLNRYHACLIRRSKIKCFYNLDFWFSDMPMKNLPVLQVKNGKPGVTFCQSGAIARHLARKFCKFNSFCRISMNSLTHVGIFECHTVYCPN